MMVFQEGVVLRKSALFALLVFSSLSRIEAGLELKVTKGEGFSCFIDYGISMPVDKDGNPFLIKSMETVQDSAKINSTKVVGKTKDGREFEITNTGKDGVRLESRPVVFLNKRFRQKIHTGQGSAAVRAFADPWAAAFAPESIGLKPEFDRVTSHGVRAWVVKTSAEKGPDAERWNFLQTFLPPSANDLSVLRKNESYKKRFKGCVNYRGGGKRIPVLEQEGSDYCALDLKNHLCEGAPERTLWFGEKYAEVTNDISGKMRAFDKQDTLIVGESKWKRQLKENWQKKKSFFRKLTSCLFPSLQREKSVDRTRTIN